MKRLIILLSILLPLSAIAQSPTFDTLFKEYSQKEDCTTINISNAMFRSMNVNIDAEYMQIIAVENEGLIATFRAQAHESTQGLDVIMSVNSDGETVDILQQRNDKDETTGIYILTCSKEECVFMHIKGHNLELSNISSIMENF